MVGRTTQSCLCRGISLVDTMVSVAIISVAVIGTSSFRYYAALDSRKATIQITAVRTAVLLCESWRAVADPNAYDPTAYFSTDLKLTECPAATGLPDEEGFTRLGGYKLVLNNHSYYATLSWKNISAGMRALNVVVAWAQRDQDDVSNADESLRVTVYSLI